MMKLVAFLISSILAAVVFTFKKPGSIRVRHTKIYYNFDKTFKKEKDIKVGRLLKNVLFPGIYRDYDDTAEPIKTVKVVTKTAGRSRNEGDSFFSDTAKEGTYNAVDTKSIPREVDTQQIRTKALKPIAKPANFQAPASAAKAGAVKASGQTPIMANLGKRPSKPLILYEYEASSDCARVRKACAMLDISLEIRPCPGATSGFADSLSTVTLGKRVVPYLFDNNPSMYKPQLEGATEILEYLFTTYGPPDNSKVPGSLKSSFSLFGGSKGGKVRSDARPDFARIKPITLYGWEDAPYVAPVRKMLDSLAIPHVFVSCAPGSVNRQRLVAKGNEAPYIEDPNTGVSMGDSAAIVKYLESTYTI